MRKLTSEQLADRVLYAGRMRTMAQIEAFRVKNNSRARNNPGQKRAWRGANRQKVRDSNKRCRDRLAARLGPDQYAAEQRRWKGLPVPTRPDPKLCELCGGHPSFNGPNASRLHLDHDHASGKFRGWLCGRCNAGLGRFKDNPALLRKAALYLEINT